MINDIYAWLLVNWRTVAEILTLAAAIFVILRMIRSARGLSIVRGMISIALVVFMILYFSSLALNLPNINWLLERFIPLLLVTLLIIFQPELRHAFVKIGQHKRFLLLSSRKKFKFIKVLSNSTFKLSERRIGAIIAFQREDSLSRYIEGGIKLDAEISSDLVLSIFFPGSPLHDGAVIIANERIQSASSLFPLSESSKIQPNHGTRHRAGIGITEETDAMVIIVSEETGRVSIAVRGHLTEGITMEDLEKTLNELYNKDESKSSGLDLSKES